MFTVNRAMFIFLSDTGGAGSNEKNATLEVRDQAQIKPCPYPLDGVITLSPDIRSSQCVYLPVNMSLLVSL